MRQETEHALKDYRDHGIPPGGFLTACLENNLCDAFGRADPFGAIELHEIVQWLVWQIPDIAWGNRGKVDAWLRAKAKQREAAEAFLEGIRP